MTKPETLYLVALACTLAAGCRSAPQPDARVSILTPTQSATASLAGRWRLERDPPALGPGIQMEILVDSVSGTGIHGRLTSYFAGDVGGDPASFPHFAGSVDSLAQVSLWIETVTGDRAFVLRGPLKGDTIPLEVFVVGPDTATVPGIAWRLIRP